MALLADHRSILREALSQRVDIGSLDEALGLKELTFNLTTSAAVAAGSRDTRSSIEALAILLIGVIHQNNTLSTTVSKLGDDITSLRELMAAPKAAPPSDPLITQKLDTLIGRTSIPPPTPQAPNRPTPPAKPAQPRATPTHAQVVLLWRYVA